MSADLLRRAAAELRAAAEKAQNAKPWCPNYTWSAIRHVQRNVDLDLDCADHPDEGCPSFGMYDGHYVALMHPPVALALAESLDNWAEIVDGVDKMLGYIPDDAYPAEFAVARAILREES